MLFFLMVTNRSVRDAKPAGDFTISSGMMIVSFLALPFEPTIVPSIALSTGRP